MTQEDAELWEDIRNSVNDMTDFEVMNNAKDYMPGTLKRAIERLRDELTDSIYLSVKERQRNENR
jgi:hypothetical protein